MNKQEAEKEIESLEEKIDELKKIIDVSDINVILNQVNNVDDACNITGLRLITHVDDTSDEVAYKELKMIVAAVCELN